MVKIGGLVEAVLLQIWVAPAAFVPLAAWRPDKRPSFLESEKTMQKVRQERGARDSKVIECSGVERTVHGSSARFKSWWLRLDKVFVALVDEDALKLSFANHQSTEAR